MPRPDMTLLESQITLAIRLSLQVYHDQAYHQWAEAWSTRRDRLSVAAYAAADGAAAYAAAAADDAAAAAAAGAAADAAYAAAAADVAYAAAYAAAAAAANTSYAAAANTSYAAAYAAAAAAAADSIRCALQAGAIITVSDRPAYIIFRLRQWAQDAPGTTIDTELDTELSNRPVTDSLPPVPYKKIQLEQLGYFVRLSDNLKLQFTEKYPLCLGPLCRYQGHPNDFYCTRQINHNGPHVAHAGGIAVAIAEEPLRVLVRRIRAAAH